MVHFAANVRTTRDEDGQRGEKAKNTESEGRGLSRAEALQDAHLKNRHIKGASSQVKDQDGLIGLLLEAVGQRSCCGLVHNPENINPGDAASILGGLPLRVVEVGWHSDDSLLNLQQI